MAEMDLVATARRVASRQWTVGCEGAAEMETNAELADLVGRGYARLYFTPAYQRADDYWVLTPEGEQWLSQQS